MNKTLICLMVPLLLASLNVASQDDITVSERVNTQTKLEVNSPFVNDLPLYDSDTKLYFKIANDSTKLYLCFKVSDRFQQQKILRSGMVVTLFSKGAKKHKVSINYPLPDDEKDMIFDNSPLPLSRKNEKKHQRDLLLKKNKVELKGFATENGLIEVDPTSFVYLGIDFDSKESMFYEIIIPYTEYFGDNYTPKDLLSEFKLEVKINALPKLDSQPNGLPQGRGGGPNGGGSGHGGGMGPGGGSGTGEGMGPSGGMPSGGGVPGDMGPSGDMQDFQKTTSEQKFKQKFKLNTK